MKYGALRGKDDGDADEGKAAAGALAKLTSADYQRFRKVFNEKQGNDCRRQVLVNNLDDEIALRGAGMVQNMANPRKETTKAVLETQGREVLQTPVLMANQDSGTAVPSKGRPRIKTVATASLAKAHKHGIAGTQREAAGAKETKELEQGSEKQGPLRSRASGSLQHQGPPGAKEQETRTAGVERFQEFPATEAFRN